MTHPVRILMFASGFGSAGIISLIHARDTVPPPLWHGLGLLAIGLLFMLYASLKETR